jgi:hypothetical protein
MFAALELHDDFRHHVADVDRLDGENPLLTRFQRDTAPRVRFPMLARDCELWSLK